MNDYSPAPDRVQPIFPVRDGGLVELLLCRVDTYWFALPTSSIERIVRMAELGRTPSPWPGVVGIFNLHGSTLPVVDPRAHLGLGESQPKVDHRLIVMRADSRFVLWVDEAERVVALHARDLDILDTGSDRPLVPYVARVDGAVTWVLSPLALDPGERVEAAA